MYHLRTYVLRVQSTCLLTYLYFILFKRCLNAVGKKFHYRTSEKQCWRNIQCWLLSQDIIMHGLSAIRSYPPLSEMPEAELRESWLTVTNLKPVPCSSTMPHSAKRLRTVETSAFIPEEIDEAEYKRHEAQLKKQARLCQISHRWRLWFLKHMLTGELGSIVIKS